MNKQQVIRIRTYEYEYDMYYLRREFKFEI